MKVNSISQLTVSILLLCAANSLTNVAAAPSPANSGGPSSVGDTEAKALQASSLKYETDLFTGSFNYSIPIEGAPARNGSEPKLSLSYSSSGENGWCGVGWSLEIGYIERYTKDGIPVPWDTAVPPAPKLEYDDSKGFVFNLFGKQGRLISIGNNEYRAEVEQDFMRFIFDPTNNRWQVYDKSGNMFYFGKNVPSRIQNTKQGWATLNGKGTFRWALDEVVTVTGDLTTISYQTFGAEKMLYPNLISYNGHQSHNGLTGALTPTHTIQFVLQSRSDKRISYRSAFRVEQTRRLQKVICKVGTQLVRRYELTYEPGYSLSTKASRLQQVQSFGNDDTSALPAQTFSYSEKDFFFKPNLVDWVDMNVPNPAEHYWESVSSYGNTAMQGTDIIDIDGDALPDRVRMSAAPGPYSNFQVQRNLRIQADGKGHFSTVTAWGPVLGQNQPQEESWWRSLSSGYCRFLDIDGDARPDRVMDYKNYYTDNSPTYDRLIIERNTGTGFSEATWLGINTQNNYPTLNAIENPGWVKVVDINGDNIPDRVMAEQQTLAQAFDYFMVQLGNGSGFGTVRKFGPYSSQGSQQDVPGDTYFGLIEGLYIKFVDINGDGLPDRVMYPYDSTVSGPVPPQNFTKMVVEFNNGYSFETGDWLGVNPQYTTTDPSNPNFPINVTMYAHLENFPYVGLFDMNGDNLPDRVMLKHSDHSKWWVQVNNGSGFEPPRDFSNVLPPPNGIDHIWWYGIHTVNDFQNGLSAISDINGDGLVDRVMADNDALNSPNPGFAGFRVSLSSGIVPDLLQTVNNGIGGSLAIQYKPSTTWNNRKDPVNANSEAMLPFVVQTVSAVAISDGINPARTTTYDYEGGFYNASRKEFAGFASAKIIDPPSVVDPTRPPRKQVHWFHQGGGRDNAANGEFADVGKFAKKGMTYRIETYGNDSPTPLLYNVVVNKVEATDLSGGTGTSRWFPFVQKTIVFNYPGGGTPKATATGFVFDSATGNLTKKTAYGQVTGWNLTDFSTTDADLLDTQFNHISYATISGNSNIKDHPSSIRITADDAGTPAQTVKETKYTYYANHGSLNTEETRICEGQYAVESRTYDTFGNVVLSTDATGLQTKVDTIESAYRMYATTTRKRANSDGSDNAALDHFTDTTYDARSGLVTESTDPMKIKVKNTYDVFFRLRQVEKGTSPDSSPNLWSKIIDYTLGGIAAGVSLNSIRLRVNDGTDSIGMDSWSYADGLGRIIEVRTEAEVNNQYRVVNMVHDERGTVFLKTWSRPELGQAFTKPSDALPLAAEYNGFDPAGRIAEIRERVNASFSTAGVYLNKTDSTGDTFSPLGARTWQYRNGPEPWWVVFADEEGKTRRYQLDGFGRTNIIQEVEGVNTYTTTLKYDRVGNLIEIMNHNLEQIHFGYDDAGNMVAMADPHLGQWKYKHDKAGRLREQTDANAQKVVFDYNATLSRLSAKKVYNAANQLVSTASYVYDNKDDGDPNFTVYKGLLYKVTDNEGWVKSSYDTRGRLNKSTRHLNINNKDYTTTYGHNDGDKITSTVYPNSGPTINYEYHGSGEVKRVHRAGFELYVTLSQSFDEFGRVKVSASANASGAMDTVREFYPISKRLQSIKVGPSGSVLTKTYKINKADDVTSLTTLIGGVGGTVDITYDDLHRIKTYTGLGGGQPYVYDAVGNITASIEGVGSTYTYGFARKQAVKTAFGKTYQYDRCGNMIVRGAQALEYDAENRLKRLTQAGTIVVEYGYSAEGERLWKRKNGDNTTLQVWIGNIYEEKDGKTLFHVSARDERVCSFEPGSYLAGGTGGSATHVGYYYHEDHLNSSSAMTGAGGELVEGNVWFPFGRTTGPSPQAPFQVSRRFTSQILDSETGLYYYGARYYDPEIGRFIQADTVLPDLENPQAYNRYAYTLNNPLKYVDPDGHQARPSGYTSRPGGFLQYQLEFQRFMTRTEQETAVRLSVYPSSFQRAVEANMREREQFIAYGRALRLGESWITAPRTSATRNVPLHENYNVSSAFSSGTATFGQARGQNVHDALSGSRFWTTSEFQGIRVYQRTDLIDPARIDAIGRSSLSRMREGLAPIGPDGKEINLHHTIQSSAGPVAEVTQTFHQQYRKTLHINPNSIPSGIDRPTFERWKKQYWINRAQSFDE
jgi:RHS repeat-associated protein